MEQDYTIEDLCKVLYALGKHSHGADCGHPFALGTITGLVDFYLRNKMLDRLQSAVNDRYLQAKKDLAEKESSSIIKSDE